jgi:hypothetical protein
MNYDISDVEKMQAEKAITAFSKLIKVIDVFADHLQKMFIPFKENQDITPEQIWKFRRTFRDYRDRAEENLDNMKEAAFHCAQIMMTFMSDTQVEKLMKSFNMSIDDVSKQFRIFKDYFNNLQADDFKDNAVKTLDTMSKEIDQLKEIVDERIQSYLETDILAKSWVDEAGGDNHIEEKVPYDSKLFDAQQQELSKTK